ncbi:MAG: hypothetical protein JNL39_01175 [Opitutaceae bacterium]|nr:hypothetical protein [Opitutaceae bacterium]
MFLIEMTNSHRLCHRSPGFPRVARLLLLTSICLVASVRLVSQGTSAYSRVAPYFGVYFGTFEETGGPWAMTVSWLGEETFEFVGRLSDDGPYIRSYPYAAYVSPSGEFSDIQPDITGTIAAGRVSGTTNTRGPNRPAGATHRFSGAIDSGGGATSVFAGLWTRSIVGATLPTVEAFVGPSGMALVAMSSSLTNGVVGFTRVDQHGEFAVTLSNGTRLSGRIDVGARQLAIAIAPDELPPAPRGAAQIANFSTLASVDSRGTAVLQRLAVIGDKNREKPLLFRAVGSGLSPVLGTVNALDQIGLDFWREGGVRLAAIDGWDTSDAALARATLQVGALPLAAAGMDAARILSLAPGDYGTALRAAPSAGSAAVLAEIFDLDPENGRIAHVSARGRIGPGRETLVAGFAITGEKPALILARAIGPKLAAFGVTDSLADPQLQIVRSDGTPVAQNDNWSANDTPLSWSLQKAGGIRSDFGSKDAALLLTLPPGAYLAIVRGANDTRGTAQIEISDATALPATTAPLTVETFTVQMSRVGGRYYYEPRIRVTSATAITVTGVTFAFPRETQGRIPEAPVSRAIAAGGSEELIRILYGEPEITFDSSSINADVVTVALTYRDADQREHSVTAMAQVTPLSGPTAQQTHP